MKARKPHWCLICRQTIEIGQEYDWLFHPGYRGIRKEEAHTVCLDGLSAEEHNYLKTANSREIFREIYRWERTKRTLGWIKEQAKPKEVRNDT